MNNVLAAAESELSFETPTDRTGGSVEDATDDNIKISMTGKMAEAWRKMKGFKLPCHTAFAFNFTLAE
jgi:hypothetical protein